MHRARIVPARIASLHHHAHGVLYIKLLHKIS